MITLVTGSTGRLGKELVTALGDCLHPARNELDIRNGSAVERYVREHVPDRVVHSAALTGVRECEENRGLAWENNVYGTENLVRAVGKHCPTCRFLYVSTASVFRGDSGMNVETGIPYPVNFYSLTKLLGEVITARLPNHQIVRTNFAARERWKYSKAFVDRFGTYLFADQVALGIRELLESNLTGVVHIVGDRRISMFEFAKLTTPDVQAMTLAEYSGPPLPVDMSLDTIRWRKYRVRAPP